MFWSLILGHLLADYPLQSKWMVSNKMNYRVLIVHVVIHFLVSFVLVSIVNFRAWPLVLVLALIHFVIDSGKNFVNKIKPEWILAPYVIDQILHFLSIYGIANFIGSAYGVAVFSQKPLWLILAIVYVSITYVWQISERILVYQDPTYRDRVIEYAMSRMIARVILFTGLLFLLTTIFPGTLITSSLLVFPYRQEDYGVRALITDILVSIIGIIIVILIS
jgi:hypothetical protein